MIIDFYVLLKDRHDNIAGVAMCDAVHAASLCRHRWGLHQGYATRKSKGRQLLMHRVVAATPPGMDTDHINGQTLDNRRSNLRHATRTQNQCNRGRDLGGVSEFKGVDRMSSGKWRARISVPGARLFLGTFDTEFEAATAYDIACVKAHGAFARPNIPIVGNATPHERHDWRPSAGVHEVTLEAS